MEVTWLNISFSLLFCWVAFKILLRRRRIHPHLPPSPPAIPIIGHLHLLMKPPIHRHLQSLSQKYGPIFSLRFGSRLVVVISSPSTVEECFTKNDMIFANRPHFLFGKYIAYNNTTVAAAPYGEHWRNLRRLSTLEIFSSNRLNMFLGVRRDEVKFLLRRLSRDSMHNFARVELRPMFTELACNIIMRMVTGKRYYGEDVDSEKAKQFQEIIREIFELDGASNPADFLPLLQWVDFGGYEKKLVKVNRKKEEIFQGLIDEHRNPNSSIMNTDTMIDHLLLMQKSEPEYYTDEIIKGLILVLIFAGTDTTSTTIEWAMSLLLNHPDALRKARVELESHVGKDRLIEESDFPKLQYLQSIISETLRLYPAAPLLVPHMSSDNCQVGGFDIPKDTILLVNAWAIHRDPKLWEDPTSFEPERFENGESETYKLLPFGLGRRACPGGGLANRVVGLVLGSLIQCYNWERVNEKEIGMAEEKGLTMTKKEPLEAMCKARAIIRKGVVKV